jgi:GT2 family glycosyltransferase
LAVVIVTFNSADTLPDLLSSLQTGLAHHDERDIVVVDNASSDASVATVKHHPVGARVICSPVNGGYASAINMATATIRPDADLLILNPDIRLFETTVAQLQTCLGDPAVGVAVPKILKETGELSFSLRRNLTVASAWSEALLGGRVSNALGLGEVIAEPHIYREQQEVEWATGAILLVSADARKRVGNWDESFFLYSEEVDFMRRVRRAGLTVRYHPQAQAVHIGGDTRASPFLYSLLTANRVLDYSRHHNRLATALLRCGAIFGEVLRAWKGREHRAALRILLGSKLILPTHTQAR